MTVMQTGALQMPPVLAKKLITDVKTKSTVAALSAKEPKLFGADEKYIQFTGKPRAQFVEEGQAKSSSTPSLGSFQSATHTAQVTMRTSNQVKWADERISTELEAVKGRIGRHAEKLTNDHNQIGRIETEVELMKAMLGLPPSPGTPAPPHTEGQQ